jgi:protein subunit release factor B
VPSLEKIAALEARMLGLGITDDNLLEKFIQGSGSGGQKVNKTASCVQLIHGPSGISIKCQRGRSRELNRYYARKELCEQIEEHKLGVLSRRRQVADKIRRQKRRRSRRQKEKILVGKRKQSQKKVLRKRVDEDSE